MSSILHAAEVSRITAIVNECIEKLQFLGAIAPDVLSHRDELTAFVGGEISRIISQQRELESRYENLINERGALRGLNNKTKYKEVQMEIQDVSHALRESTKSLCRNLKDNPNIAGNLSKIHRERTELIDALTSTIAELQGNGIFESLKSRVSDDRASQANQKEILRKERQTAAAVKQLDSDLEAERSEHAQIVTEQREEMAMLKEQLLNVRTRASVDVRFQRAEANAKSASILRSFKQKETEVRYTHTHTHTHKREQMIWQRYDLFHLVFFLLLLLFFFHYSGDFLPSLNHSLSLSASDGSVHQGARGETFCGKDSER